MSIIEIFPELKSYTDNKFRRAKIEKNVIMIAMTARTGSSHLCSAISSVMKAGRATEIFNPRGTVQFEVSKRNTPDFYSYMKSLEDDADDVFIFKTNWIDLQPFIGGYKYLFPKLHVVYLNRLDIEEQAVSLYKAIVSDKWHDSKTINNKSKVSSETILERFDLVRICKCIDELQSEKRYWESFFFKENIHPCRLNYESFAHDIDQAIHYILDYFELKRKSPVIVSDFKKIYDNVNEQWLLKVRNYRNGNFYQRMKNEGLIK